MSIVLDHHPFSRASNVRNPTLHAFVQYAGGASGVLRLRRNASLPVQRFSAPRHAMPRFAKNADWAAELRMDGHV
jgi:hypothetical protein